MSWNHRVVRTEHQYGATYAVHEAYYPTLCSSLPNRITTEPVAAVGETLDELRECLQKQLRALDRTPLELIDGEVTEYDP